MVKSRRKLLNELGGLRRSNNALKSELDALRLPEGELWRKAHTLFQENLRLRAELEQIRKQRASFP
ncbi:MAG: hypothetical protein HY394_02540 [Candidatus Diapherotrites archaeon]|nr:hypothetical protein [Candidatus Diapherotrites archaeon]